MVLEKQGRLRAAMANVKRGENEVIRGVGLGFLITLTSLFALGKYLFTGGP